MATTSTQAQTKTMQSSSGAAALTLAGTDPRASGSTYFRPWKAPGGGGSGGGSGPPGGTPGRGSGPPGGGGPGGGPGGTLGHPGGGTGQGKLGGNPPQIFDGDRAKADSFMNAWNLYRLANHDAEQMSMPMKRAALFLGFIQGPQVDKWVIQENPKHSGSNEHRKSANR